MPKMRKPNGKRQPGLFRQDSTSIHNPKERRLHRRQNHPILLQKLRVHRALQRKIPEKSITTNADESTKHSAAARQENYILCEKGSHGCSITLADRLNMFEPRLFNSLTNLFNHLSTRPSSWLGSPITFP
jgi:hypothetical protein